MATFTPGPWSLDGRMVLGRAFDGSERAIVDEVRGGTRAQADSNARLIAAAPDLYAALEGAVKTIRAWHEMHGSDEMSWQTYLTRSPEMQVITAAFMKVEGA